tara:strand:+ start:154 stop:441 length:288 start_codon:yes stop_codon:yes gene_type:complete
LITGEKINTVEKLTIDASRVNRYLSYPRKVPIWKLMFSLPKECVLYRDEDNSDIAVEIENMIGFAIVPALSEDESLRRLKGLIPSIELKDKIIRL